MRSSKDFPVRQSGIYRNLPTIDPSVTGLTAIVTGATGISGWNTIRSLLDSPNRWAKIYALTRSPPSKDLLSLLDTDQQSRIQHVPIDFLSSPEDVAQALKSANVTATHVFCYAYLQPKAKPGESVWSNAEELLEVNEKIFSNFIKALPLTQIRPKRILLQTGGKNYGFQFGRVRQPNVESDPQPRHLGPNFYYPQEDLLHAYCRDNPGTNWNVIMPFGVIGASNSVQMNAMYTLAVYAAVQAHRGEPLRFPGDWSSWQAGSPLSTARLTGYLSEWAILEEACANQSFNAEDTSPISWDRFFQELSRWYGVEQGVLGPSDDGHDLNRNTIQGGKDSPMGHGPAITYGTSFRFPDWANDPATHTAWREIMVTSSSDSIKINPFDDNPELIFGLADVLFYPPPVVSMNKAKRFGWTGFVDTVESSFEAAQDMARLGMLPYPVVDAAIPMI